jgi:hypothetical protein
MAAKGAIAKENVIDKIKTAFGEDFVGIYDKKIYVWADDGDGKVQISLSLTCPKNLVGAFDGERIEFETAEPVSSTISTEEKETIAQLMARLGL